MRRFLKVLNLTCFCIPLLFVQCHHSQNAGNCEKYLELAQAGQNYMYKSRFELNPSFLDSALMCFNEAEQLCPNKKSVMSYNKSFAYFDKKDYGNAVKMLELSADSLFFYPEYKTVLIERILAKSAGEQGDSIEQKRHYKTVVANLDHYITSFRMEADSIMKLSDWNNIPHISNADAPQNYPGSVPVLFPAYSQPGFCDRRSVFLSDIVNPAIYTKSEISG